MTRSAGSTRKWFAPFFLLLTLGLAQTLLDLKIPNLYQSRSGESDGLGLPLTKMIQRMRHEGITDYRISPAVLAESTMQRLIEGGWPMRPSTNSGYLVFKRGELLPTNRRCRILQTDEEWSLADCRDLPNVL